MPARGRLAPLLALVAALVAACGGPEARNDDPRLDRADQLVLDGDFEEVERLARAVLAEFPGTGRAELLCGYSLQKRKRYTQAEPHFERALELEEFEKQASAWNLLGWCRYNQGRLAEAREAFRAHLEHAPDHDHSHYGLGLAALDDGLFDEAETSLRRAIELQEQGLGEGKGWLRADLAVSHCRLADVHVAREAWTEARDEFLAGLQLYEPLYSDWFKLHQVFQEMGEPERAALCLEKHDHWKRQAEEAAAGG